MKFNGFSVFLFLMIAFRVSSQTLAYPAIPLLTVGGEATVKMAPDQAVIVIDIEKSVSSGDITAATAAFLFNNEDIQIKMISSEEREVKESVPMVRAEESGSPTFVKEYTITVKNIAKLQDVVIDLYKRNLGSITYIGYRYSGMDSLFAQARKQAIANAHARAIAYADALVQNIGKANTVKEDVMEVRNAFEPYNPETGSDMIGEKVVMNPGLITVYCKVSVSYDLVK